MSALYGLRLAHVELKRSWRRLVSTRRRQILIGIILFGFGITLIGSLQDMYQFGKLSSHPPIPQVLPMARQQFTHLFVLVVILVAIRTIERLSRVDGKEFLLTTVPPRTIVFGVLLAEFSRLTAAFSLLTSLFLFAFVLGSGSYLSLAIVPAVAIPLLAVSLLSGYILGLIARIAAMRLERLSLAKYALIAVGVLVLVVLVQPFLVTAGILSVPLIELPANFLDVIPLNWYALLFFVGTPFSVPIPIESFAVAASFILAIPFLFESAARLSGVLWFEDSDHAEQSRGTYLRRTQAPDNSTSYKSVWLARWLWYRNLRRPQYFVRLVYLAFIFGLPAIQMLSNTDELYRYGPVLVAIIGAILSGQLYAIMPMESEGRILPLLLTTPGSGRLFARARILAGLLFALPVIAVAVFVIGILGAWDGIQILTAIIFGSVLTVSSTVFALAIGAFSSTTYSQSRLRDESITANSIAVGVHTVATMIVGILGFAFILAPEFFQALLWDPQLSQSTITFSGIGFLIGLLTLFAGGCYRYAMRQYESVTL